MAGIYAIASLILLLIVKFITPMFPKFPEIMSSVEFRYKLSRGSILPKPNFNRILLKVTMKFRYDKLDTNSVTKNNGTDILGGMPFLDKSLCNAMNGSRVVKPI